MGQDTSLVIQRPATGIKDAFLKNQTPVSPKPALAFDLLCHHS